MLRCVDGQARALTPDHQVDCGFESGAGGCGARSDDHRDAALLVRPEAAEQEVRRVLGMIRAVELGGEQVALAT